VLFRSVLYYGYYFLSSEAFFLNSSLEGGAYQPPRFENVISLYSGFQDTDFSV